ncbi:immunoglobulin-like and fibronectin type III domain-containing protein 1 [Lates japonicus]|nr:immunoglobulin-like and fibronectin type III domain-containing protein 1 [Lates japonicus]
MLCGKTAAIRKRSKTPGVMITQYVVNIPDGKSTPDFQCKPVPVTVQEGQLAVFKAVVTGDPKPEVSWRRAKGTVSDKDKFQSKYDESTGEHILEIHKVSAAETDTFKCYAVNEFGKAVCTATLSVTEASTNPSDFRKLLRKSKVEKAGGETDERFWNAMLNADRKDYERICAEFGVADLHLVLKKLEEKKKERMQNKCKDGVIPYDEDATDKHGVKSVGRTKDFSIKGLMQKDTGLNQVDVEMANLLETVLNQTGAEEVNFLPKEFKLSNVDFVIRIQEIKVQEREDALFECVLTHPLPKITWMGKGSILEDGEKYSITVSDHKLIHRLLIRDCKQLDKGIYSAVAGITSCSAWLVVEADCDPTSAGKKKCRKTTLAGGAQIDLEKVAKEQQIKNSEEMEKILAAVKAKRKRQGPLIEDLVIVPNSSLLSMLDPGVQFICGLSDVSAIINETAELTCKLNSEDCEGAWFRDGKKISPDDNFTITKDGAIHKLVIIRCTEEHSGKYRFEADGRKTEAMINVKDPPRFDPEDLSAFTEPVTVKVGHHAIFKLHFVGYAPIKIQWYREGEELHDDNNTKIEKSASHSRLLLSRCQRKDTGEIKIKLKNEHGFIEAISQLIVLAFPGPPAPPKVVSAYDDCINLSWSSPSNTGGSRILGYILEKRKKGSNLWTVVNAMDELIKEKKYAVKDVVAGMEYEFRVTAINLSGTGEFSNPSEFVFARDPKKPPGKVTGLKVTETSYNHMVLTWTKPEEREGIQDEAKGYFVEIRQADCIEWSRCNGAPIITTSFSVKGLKSMDMYWVRVIATNDGGESAPEELANYVIAMPSPVRPKFTNHKMKSFMVVRAGNSVRITVNFEASPRPVIMWLKDNVPVAKRATISNSDGSSQLLIPSSERSDSGIYSIVVKNLAGQETFSTEVRVTDDPKPPGPVELEENVPGTVTVIWEPSPDEKRDDRLHYTVSKLDSTKRTWTTVADRLFNNKFTVCNIMHGREYHFRVYAKNDMGISAPSESLTWGMEKKREKFVVNVPTRKDCDLRCAPTFIVPLKLHTAPKGYECYMSCAVKGNPKPRITWYRNHISINTNTNYYISDTCGVCSMLILRVGPKDMGEYTITAENALGRAECSTVLSVRE